jgi:hypothetical protein
LYRGCIAAMALNVTALASDWIIVEPVPYFVSAARGWHNILYI